MSEQKKRNQYAFDKEKYDHAHIQFPKGKKDKIKAHAESKGMSLNAYIKALIEKDSGIEL